MSIAGPLGLRVCRCHTFTYSIVNNGMLGILEAKTQNGEVLFRRTYTATLTPACTGRGVAGRPRYDWSVRTQPNAILITVTATAPVTCPGGKGTTARCTSTISVDLYAAAPQLRVITIDVNYFEIGHAAIELVCGEFRTIYGYYASNLNDYAGSVAGQPGAVVTYSSSDVTDTLGLGYSGFYPQYKKRIWPVYVNCDQWNAVRRYWEDLKRNPGTYRVIPIGADGNCATRAMESLQDARIFDFESDGGDMPTTPVGVTGLMGANEDSSFNDYPPQDPIYVGPRLTLP